MDIVVLVGLCLVGAAAIQAVAHFVTPVRITPRLRISPPAQLMLPQRMPMAAIEADIPPSTFVLHTNPVPQCAMSKHIKYQLKLAITRMKHWWATLIIEDADSFNMWWETTAVNARKRVYHGRRRYDEKINDYDWRNRWATHNTQAWPTLATSGNAYDIDLVPLQPLEDVVIDRERIEFDTGETSIGSLNLAWDETQEFVRPELHHRTLVAG